MGAFLAAFEPVILVVHFIVAFFLIVSILLQSGKGTDISSMFGAGGSQSLFGARGGATFLTKLTTGVAMVFLFTSLSLATISNYVAAGGGNRSVIEQDEVAASQPPASPTEKSATQHPESATKAPQGSDAKKTEHGDH